MNERWKPVVGFEDRYEVSNLGHVRSLYSGRNKNRIPRLLNPSLTPKGYLFVKLQNGELIRNTGVHRLVLEAFLGPCPEGCETSHLDGDPANNALSNLAWETSKQNSSRKFEHGTMYRGVGHIHAKLTPKDVRKIREMIADETPLSWIADFFGVVPKTIRRIMEGKTWKHVEGGDQCRI